MSGWLPVETAQARLLALSPPLPTTQKPLADALNHYLAQALVARRTQPSAALSAMDGYAIRFADLPGPWTGAGHIAAGQAMPGAIAAGETMRIFTGAPLPAGADTILIQEDATAEAHNIRLTGDGPAHRGQHVRVAGGDFLAGAQLAAAGTCVTPGVIALAAMAGHAAVTVGQAPRIAIIATGDELVPVGTVPGPGQIPESNGVMLAAMLAPLPANILQIRHIGDDRDATIAAIHDASAAHDVIVTIGGASVGDHDHVHAALTSLGAPPDFWKVAMRPGKPLMAARLGNATILGLPGNPASAFVTAQLFLLPLIRHLAGASSPFPPVRYGRLSADLGAGGPRRDYLRAQVDGATITPCASQDSGFVTALALTNALLIRESGSAAQPAGTLVPYIAF